MTPALVAVFGICAEHGAYEPHCQDCEVRRMAAVEHLLALISKAENAISESTS